MAFDPTKSEFEAWWFSTPVVAPPTYIDSMKNSAAAAWRAAWRRAWCNARGIEYPPTAEQLSDPPTPS